MNKIKTYRELKQFLLNNKFECVDLTYNGEELMQSREG